MSVIMKGAGWVQSSWQTQKIQRMIQRRMKTKRVLAFILACAVMWNTVSFQQADAAKKVALNKSKISLTVGQQKVITLKNTTKKVSFRVVSGKKYISLKKKTKTCFTIVRIWSASILAS